MRYPEKDQAGESAKSIPFTSHSGPRVAARGDVQVIPHPDAVSMKSSGRSVRKIHSFYVPLWPRVAALGDALGHTAPRCGIQEKIRQECPPNPFLLRPTLDPASQRGVTRSHTAPRCGIQKMLERESPQDTFPFASLSGPRVAARGDVQSYRTPMRYPGKARAGEPARYIPFCVPLWTPRRSAG